MSIDIIITMYWKQKRKAIHKNRKVSVLTIKDIESIWRNDEYNCPMCLEI